MRVNVYAEEITDRIEIIGKEIDGHVDRRRFLGLLAAAPAAPLLAKVEPERERYGVWMWCRRYAGLRRSDVRWSGRRYSIICHPPT